MGSISKRHQGELDLISDKAVQAWAWAVGEDVNPGVLDEDDLKEAYNSVFESIQYDLDELAKRVGSLSHSESYLRGSLFPKIWITLQNRGVFYDFDYDPKEGVYYGDIRLSKSADIRSRLLRKRTPAGRLYREWNDRATEDRTGKRKTKNSNAINWNQEIVDAMNEGAIEALRSPTGTVKEQMGQKMVAIQWFVARRAWSELGLRGDFRIVDGEEWADGWFWFTGHSKQTQKEKSGEKEEIQWKFPIFGVDPEELLEHFQEFRAWEIEQPWYDLLADEPHELVKDALYYSTEKVLREGFAAKAFAPVIAAGYDYKLTMHRFRDLYVSRGHKYQERWAQENGKPHPQSMEWAPKYLGHFGKGAEKDTGEYLRLNFLEDLPIPVIV